MEWLFWTQSLAISEWVIRLTILPVIVLRKERPATCLAWLAIVFFEPWVGLVLYLLIGENRLGRRRLKRRRGRRRQLEASSYPDVDPLHVVDSDSPGGVPAGISAADKLPVVGGNSLSVMLHSEEVIERLIAEIDSAGHHVHLLFYIFQDDSVGRRVADALIRARSAAWHAACWPTRSARGGCSAAWRRACGSTECECCLFYP